MKSLKLLLLVLWFYCELVSGFDCSVLYDEYDSLMHKEFLRSPDNYVPTISGGISFTEFNYIQKSLFYLRKDRKDTGIGIIFTNNKLYGKFLFKWSKKDQITLHDIIIYSRIGDGYLPILTGPIELTAGQKIDLDSSDVIDNEQQVDHLEDMRADLVFLSKDNDSQLKSINQARIYFPTASLCR